MQSASSPREFRATATRISSQLIRVNDLYLRVQLLLDSPACADDAHPVRSLKKASRLLKDATCAYVQESRALNNYYLQTRDADGATREHARRRDCRASARRARAALHTRIAELRAASLTSCNTTISTISSASDTLAAETSVNLFRTSSPIAPTHLDWTEQEPGPSTGAPAARQEDFVALVENTDPSLPGRQTPAQPLGSPVAPSYFSSSNIVFTASEPVVCPPPVYGSRTNLPIYTLPQPVHSHNRAVTFTQSHAAAPHYPYASDAAAPQHPTAAAPQFSYAAAPQQPYVSFAVAPQQPTAAAPQYSYASFAAAPQHHTAAAPQFSYASYAAAPQHPTAAAPHFSYAQPAAAPQQPFAPYAAALQHSFTQPQYPGAHPQSAYPHPQPVFSTTAARPSLYPRYAGGFADPNVHRIPAAYAALATPYAGTGAYYAAPQVSSTVPLMDPYLKAVSDHVIQQEIAAQGADPFTGDAVSFWSWLGKMQENISNYSMKPRAILNMLSANTKGAPHNMIVTRISAVGSIDSATVSVVWSELVRRYGSQQLAYNQQLSKLKSFPAIQAPNVSAQLYEFSDLCYVTSTLVPLCPDLHVLDFAVGLSELVHKLPTFLQHRWEKVQYEFSLMNERSHPPFSVFAQFLQEQAQREASRLYVPPHVASNVKKPVSVNVLATSVTSAPNNSSSFSTFAPNANDIKFCLEHQASGHHLSKCNRFSKRPIFERRALIKSNKLCFSCLLAGHRSIDCKDRLTCDKCDRNHPSVMHTDWTPKESADGKVESPAAPSATTAPVPPVSSVVTMCTQICSSKEYIKTCAKTLLVDASLESNPDVVKRIYVAIDDQSNVSFIDEKLVKFFGVKFPQQNYRMSAAQSGCGIRTRGYQVSGLVLRSVVGGDPIKVPFLLSCRGLLDTRRDAATPSMVRAHASLAQHASSFPDFDDSAHTMVLLGRDCGKAMAARLLNDHEPFLYDTPLGKALVGNMCLDAQSRNEDSSVTRSCTTLCTKVSRFPVRAGVSVECESASESVDPCFHTLSTSVEPRLTSPVFVQYETTTPSLLESQDVFSTFADESREDIKGLVPPSTAEEAELHDIFHVRSDDELPGLSRNDLAFLDIMNNGVERLEDGTIQLPIPFIASKARLPDNHSAVYGRTLGTLTQLSKHSDRVTKCLAAMQHNLDQGYVEQVSDSVPHPAEGRVWYIPVFPVVHSKKLKVRLVFDASAQYLGVSINDCLYKGPELTNRLRGVLLRFRERPVAIQADIQDMFLRFKVPEYQRDYLRFYWYKDNDVSKPLVPYRATTHIFGLSSSPAVANFGLKYCALHSVEPKFESARTYVSRSFYMDDGLYSTGSPEEAVAVLGGAREMLGAYNIRLHKLLSNSSAVLSAFPPSEVIAQAEPSESTLLPVQRALGVEWEVRSDTFSPSFEPCEHPFTKRGVLATVNALGYDPAGLISPVVLVGKLFQREILPTKKSGSELITYGWDDPLPESFRPRWDTFLNSLHELSKIKVPRSFYPPCLVPALQELHVFSDASDDAIGHAIYLRSVSIEGQVHVALVVSGSRVAPRSATSTPRLELCAAAEASRAALAVLVELESKPSKVYYYSDSMVALGYLANRDRNFPKYIARRVHMTLQNSSISNWCYVNTLENPADIASRPTLPKDLVESFWFSGPSFLWNSNYTPAPYDASSSLGEPLPEERLLPDPVVTLATSTTPESEFSSCLSPLIERVSNFNKLIRIVLIVLRWKNCVASASHSAPTRDDAVKCLVRATQLECFGSHISLLSNNRELPKRSPLASFSPFLDPDGVMRVGGRLPAAKLPFDFKHPILIPDHVLARSLVAHLHMRVKHQGGHITTAAVRQAGYYLIHGSRVIRNHIKNCFLCQKLRGKIGTQMMSDLPADRLEDAPPFQHSGVDCFGPFYVGKGKATRNSSPSVKIWVALFICLPSRAIHLEPLDGLDTTSFINALSRFSAVRGTSRFLRSDRGTNFVGACNQLNGIDLKLVSTALGNKDITWVMNPPHSSHYGGVWERRIGSVRRVLEGALLQSGKKGLTRDDFVTLLQEAAAIVNNTPLWAVSSDTSDPFPLSPATLLTLQEHPNPVTQDNFTEDDLEAYGPRRYRKIQYLADQFWKRWRTEHLQQLTLRRKWQHPSRCFTAGDVVLVRDLLASRNHWETGVVTRSLIASDKRVRSVELTLPPTSGTGPRRTVVRGIHSLVLLSPASTTSGCHSGDDPH